MKHWFGETVSHQPEIRNRHGRRLGIETLRRYHILPEGTAGMEKTNLPIVLALGMQNAGLGPCTTPRVAIGVSTGHTLRPQKLQFWTLRVGKNLHWVRTNRSFYPRAPSCFVFCTCADPTSAAEPRRMRIKAMVCWNASGELISRNWVFPRNEWSYIGVSACHFFEGAVLSCGFKGKPKGKPTFWGTS